MTTGKATIGTITKLSASMADLGSVVRINSLNNNSFSFSFVLDETLQLVKTPVVNPVVHPLSSPLFSYAFEVFHNNFVSIKAGNNVFAYVMIYPSHKPLLLARDFMKQSLGGLCAFGLKFSTNKLELPFDLLDLVRVEKLAVGSDCKIIYSEVNAKNSVRTRAFDISLFGKSKQEEASLFFVNSQYAFINIPIKIFFVAGRDSEWNFDSAFDCSQTQNIIFEGCTSWEIVSHRTSINYWLGFSFLDHATGLLDAGDCKLTLQAKRTQIFVNERVQLDIIPNFVLPSSVNAELQSSLVDGESLDYFRGCLNFDFSCCSGSHNVNVGQDIFKLIASPPTLESVGIRSYEAL